MAWVLILVNDARAEDELIPLSIVVNTAEKGDYFVVLRDRIDILINNADMNLLGLIGISADEVMDGKKYINLSRHTDKLKYRINRKSLTLNLDVKPKYLQKYSRDLASEHSVSRNPFIIDSAFLNASANIRGVDDKSYRAIEFPLETVVSVKDYLLQTNFTYLREDIDGVFVTGNWYRGMSNLTRDFPQQMERLVFGDYLASTGELGGSGIYAGISYGKQYNIATRFTKHSGLTVDGILKTPSKINLYVNGNLLRTEQLPAGEFELENLPDLYGAGLLELEVVDAFGRTTKRSVDYYVSTRLLRKGLHDFNYSLGVRRSELNRADYTYAPSPTLLAYHRYGLNQYFTLGYRLEAEDKLFNYGFSTNFLLGALGDIEFNFARSQAQSIEAYSGSAKYFYTSNKFHFRFSYRENQQDYMTVSPSSANWPKDIRSASIGMHGTKIGGLSLTYTNTNYHFDLPQEVTSLNYSLRLGKKATFFLRAQTLKYGEKNTNSVFASVNVAIGQQVSTSASYAKNSDAEELSAYLQKNTPVGEGSGFRFRTRKVTNEFTGQEYPGELNIIAKTRYNILNATYFKEKTISSYNAQFASTIAFVDNQFFITRPIFDSFGLVKVGDLDNVKVYYSNEEVGETKNGTLIIPTLASYAENYLSIEAEDIPVEYALHSSRKIISPKFRTGSIADFQVQKFQGFSGVVYLRKAGKRQTADYAALTVLDSNQNYTSTIGRGGEFYLENIPVGRYEAQLLLEGEQCTFQLDVPKTNDILVELGEFFCEK